MSTAYLDALYQDVLFSADPSIVLDALFQDVLLSTNAIRLDTMHQDVLLSTNNVRLDAMWVDVLFSPAVVEEEITMRTEHQRWDKVQVLAEVVVSGAGQTGLTVTCVLQRKSDDDYLQSGGGWGASPSTLTLTEIDATNFPGMYSFAMDAADVSLADADDGYFVSVTEATTPIRQHIFLDTSRSANEFRMLGLRQSNMIVKDDNHSADGTPSEGTVYIYASAADTDLDYTAGTYGRALESYSYEVETTAGLRQRYKSVKD